MSDPFDPLDPTDSLDQEDLLEEQISGLEDAPIQPDDRLTAAELRETRSIDDELAEEIPDNARTRRAGGPLLEEYDGPDVEGQLVGDESDSQDDDGSPEERAMRTVTEAPGATDVADDGYGDDA
jgi:hypothetical protein